MTTSSTSLSKVPVTTSPDSQMGPLTEVELAEAWFDAPPPSTRRTPVPPPPVSVVGEFLGDPLADSWLR